MKVKKKIQVEICVKIVTHATYNMDGEEHE